MASLHQFGIGSCTGDNRKIIFDKFHIVRKLTQAVDKFHPQEHKALMKESMNNQKGTRYDWLNKPDRVNTGALNSYGNHH
ncbi:MAG: transposase [Rhodobacteraceae bacterium]|nr:transposase [Paracoccaceae bacterium]